MNMNKKSMGLTVTNSTAEPRTQSDTGETTASRMTSRASDDSTRNSETTASHAIRVLCVDDHAMLIAGLSAQFAIEGKIEVVGRLSSADKLLEEVKRLMPTAVMLDIEMPGPDIFEVATRLKRAYPTVRLMVLSAHIRDAYISASFAAGIEAYFAKSDELVDIVNGIYEVAKSPPGTFLLGPKVRERCRPVLNPGVRGSKAAKDRQTISWEDSGGPMTLLATLTAREAEILRLVGKGLSRNQIAAQLFRSVKTIDGHQERMMKKLGIEARADLMRFAIREGLAQP